MLWAAVLRYLVLGTYKLGRRQEILMGRPLLARGTCGIGHRSLLTISSHAFSYCRVREIGGQRAKPRDNLRYCSCGIVAGEKTIGFFVAGTNRKCYKTTLCGLSWDRCLSSEATRFAVYDCTPRTCQKPCFAAGELREGCGNKGFEGSPCFQNSKFGCWPKFGTRAPFPCIP